MLHLSQNLDCNKTDDGCGEHRLQVFMYTDLQIVGSERAEDLWWYIQAWGARQRETVVQVLATDSVLHHPANGHQHTISAKNKPQLWRKLLFSLTFAWIWPHCKS